MHLTVSRLDRVKLTERQDAVRKEPQAEGRRTRPGVYIFTEAALPRLQAIYGGAMKDLFVLYIFVALMIFNLVASFVYIFGFNGLKPGLKKSLRGFKRR